MRAGFEPKNLSVNDEFKRDNHALDPTYADQQRAGAGRSVGSTDAGKDHVDQATKFAQSPAPGEPNIAWAVLSDRVREMF